jgi:hypothetical protein
MIPKPSARNRRFRVPSNFQALKLKEYWRFHAFPGIASPMVPNLIEITATVRIFMSNILEDYNICVYKFIAAKQLTHEVYLTMTL